jgi:hypothetical protein
MDIPTLVARVQTGVDRYGEPIFGDQESALPPARFDPGGISEPVEPGRAPVVTEPTLYWRNAWPDVPADARVRVRGTVYEVIGDPADWRGDSLGGLVVQLRSVKEGASGG